MSKDIFENLVTDISAQVLQQVQQQINPVVSEAVNKRLDSLIDHTYINNTIESGISRAVTQFQPDMSVVEQNIRSLTDHWANLINAELGIKVNKILQEKINSLDLNNLILGQIDAILDPNKKTYPFPEQSIDATALNITSLKITGDNIEGGVITKFGSTGIDDQATTCKVTILDQGTVFENTLYAPRVEVKGGALIDGDLEIQGRIVDNPAYRQLVADVAENTQNSITEDVLQQHQSVIFERIQNEGLDLAKVTFNGRLLVENDRLVGVVDSQLRTVGVLQDLQTKGDTFLSDTVFVAGRRVGINTMDPKSALSVWDEEVEFSVSKNKQNVGRISVERDNTLVLGSNNQDNVILNPDGSTKIPKLQINNMTLTSSQTPPFYDAPKGTIVLNENPSLGGPLGWVSLGDARWANFGIID